MRLKQIIKRDPATSEEPKRVKPSVAGHRVFVPMLTVWGAALLGLCVLVLPQSLVNQISAISGIGPLGGHLRFVLAGVSALVGATLAYGYARAAKARAQRHAQDANAIVSNLVDRRIRPIDPAVDLDLESLDAPLEQEAAETLGGEPFSDAPDDLDADFEQVVEEDLVDPAAPADPEPTLGELSQRGYDIEAPNDTSVDGDGTPELTFTHKDFAQALIESCEGAGCEASTAEADTVELAAEDGDETPAPLPVTTYAREGAEPRPIGRAGGGGSWSLTQFAPPAPPNAQEESETQEIQELHESEPGEAHPVEQAVEQAEAEDTPRELDLAEFAELPGRNAVWVEEDVGEGAFGQETAPEPASQFEAEPEPQSFVVPASALERLRQRPANELSLVEMVERFAGALHEYQQTERAQANTAHPSRDAALAEALKALKLFTEGGFDRPAGAQAPDTSGAKSDLNETEQQLRAALAKLQTLRGAA
ncbi:MAG: hypothetical protein AAF697_04165 [Pseudomonadota bacterium]